MLSFSAQAGDDVVTQNVWTPLGPSSTMGARAVTHAGVSRHRGAFSGCLLAGQRSGHRNLTRNPASNHRRISLRGPAASGPCQGRRHGLGRPSVSAFSFSCFWSRRRSLLITTHSLHHRPSRRHHAASVHQRAARLSAALLSRIPTRSSAKPPHVPWAPSQRTAAPRQRGAEHRSQDLTSPLSATARPPDARNIPSIRLDRRQQFRRAS